ncbi:MAG: hypothetical protein ABFD49_10865 [Armatimonadota bacterium]|nr:hypothetical protein [bacterium]
MDSILNRIKSAAEVVWAGVWRRRNAIGIALAAIVVLHGAATAFLGWRVRSEIAKLKANGQPVTCTDLIPKPVPDSQNGALVFAKAFQMMQYMDSAGHMRTRQEYADAGNVLANYLDPAQREKDPTLWSKAQQASVTVGGVLDLAEKAVAYPKCQFSVHWEMGAGASFEHFSHLRQIVRFAAAKAGLEASTGNGRDAARYLNLAFQINNAIGEEPTLISPLVRVSSIRIAFSQLGYILDHCDLDSQSISLLDMTLSRTDLVSAIAAGMRGERAPHLRFFSDVVDPKTQIHKDIAAGGLYGTPFWTRWIGSYPMRPMLYLDELTYMRLMNESISNCSRAYRDLKFKYSGNRVLFYAPVTNMLHPVYSRVMASRDIGVAMIAISRMALALASYKNKFGIYPQSIDELQSKLGQKTPDDPFTGQQLVYKIQNAGYMLYSVGDDMKDDGGRTEIVPNGSKSECDIVLVVTR